MSDDWDRHQHVFECCERCLERFPGIPVDCPPGPLYPPGAELPRPVKVLFVGVAPPEKGRHFYTDPDDKLRQGLFAILTRLGWPCASISDLLRHGFLLTHTAKCAIRGTTAPSLPVSRFCASRFLKREIEMILPDAVCWLSKNVGLPVCRALSDQWGQAEEPRFGEVTTLGVAGKAVHFLPTMWPGRGWESTTEAHLESLFQTLGYKKGLAKERVEARPNRQARKRKKGAT